MRHAACRFVGSAIVTAVDPGIRAIAASRAWSIVRAVGCNSGAANAPRSTDVVTNIKKAGPALLREAQEYPCRRDDTKRDCNPYPCRMVEIG